jgi:RNA-directed DNA polymerase
VVDASQSGGFDFLGWHFEGGKKWPSKKSQGKFKEAIGSLTRRTHGQSMERIAARLNSYLRGWFEYFKHSRRWQLERYDGYIRGRLPSILRKREGKKGRGRGADHQKWSNRYFEAMNLFSLKGAHIAHCRP